MTQSPSAVARGDAALGAFTLGVASLWCMLAAYSVYPALPYSSLHNPAANTTQFAMYVPQGWSFFTRDPREEKMTMYVRRTGVWSDAVMAPHGRLSNVGGLRRRSRAQGVEAGLLLNRAAEQSPVSCKGPLETCLAALPRGRPIVNPSPKPTLCGPVAIVFQRAIPWAWLPSRRTVHMPARIVSLEVTC